MRPPKRPPSALIVAACAVFILTPRLKSEALSAAPADPVKYIADVPLVDSDGAPCVRARFGDGPEVLLAIDTGNVNTAVDTKAARAAGFKLAAINQPVPPGWFRTVIPSLRVGLLKLEGTPALVMDFVREEWPSNIVGTIAYTALKDRILQIDFAAKRVRISGVVSKREPLPGTMDRFTLTTFGEKGPPMVVARGYEVDGKRLSAQIDTLYTGSLLIYSDSIVKLGFAEKAKAQATEYFPFTDGGVNMKVAETTSESFHGVALGPEAAKVYFPTPGVHEPDGLFDATVGAALLSGTVLTLDFHNHRISVTRPLSSG